MTTKTNTAVAQAETTVRDLVDLDQKVLAKAHALMVRQRLGDTKFYTSTVPPENKAQFDEILRGRPGLHAQVEGHQDAWVSAIYPQNRTAIQNHGIRMVYRIKGKRMGRRAFLAALEARDTTEA